MKKTTRIIIAISGGLMFSINGFFVAFLLGLVQFVPVCLGLYFGLGLFKANDDKKPEKEPNNIPTS